MVAALEKPADCKQGLISSTRAVKIREGQANGTQYAAWITFLKRHLPRNKGRNLRVEKSDERGRERRKIFGRVWLYAAHVSTARREPLVHVEIKASVPWNFRELASPLFSTLTVRPRTGREIIIRPVRLALSRCGFSGRDMILLATRLTPSLKTFYRGYDAPAYRVGNSCTDSERGRVIGTGEIKMKDIGIFF